MIITEQFYVGERLFNRVYSNTNHYVARDGVSYSEACDPAEFGRTYTETNIPIDSEESTIEDKAAAYDILVGES